LFNAFFNRISLVQTNTFLFGISCKYSRTEKYINVIKDFSIEDYIQKLAEDETIPFEVIDLKNNDVLPQIKNLALNNEPPFGENTDKGFKDTLICLLFL
jgi:hypothetical protein